MAATVISFGEWLPDLPALNHPGLTVANNVEPVGTTYKNFLTLSSGGQVVPGNNPLGVGIGIADTALPYYYAGTDDGIFMSSDGATFEARSATLTPANFNFVQYKNRMIVSGPVTSPLLSHTVGSATNFSTLTGSAGNAPAALYLGIIGQFVFAGYTNEAVNGTVSYRIQWSGIDNSTSWPVANSATAIAQQSGEQFMDSARGVVTGFSNGDQWGLVFQESAITRITYVGPPVVFQFDKITDKIGCEFPRSIVKVGNATYFMNQTGAYRTDGVSIEHLSHNKCAEYLRARISVFNTANKTLYGAYNKYKKLIYWTFATDSGGALTATNMLILNTADGRFAVADYSAAAAIYGTTGIEDNNLQTIAYVRGFGTSNTFGSLSATAGSATITTGDVELNPGGRAYIDGVKPNIESTGTAPAITVRVGSRSDLGTTPSYTATTTPTTRTGFADMRVDAKYFRAEVQIVGAFDSAVGVEFRAQPTGET
jgi:hypothetical protein